ncbi:MAG: hypothetical protein E7083_07640 [Bacteroidales bacterium]|nr:hypothetical protein [Bacteroidales bacterium]
MSKKSNNLLSLTRVTPKNKKTEKKSREISNIKRDNKRLDILERTLHYWNAMQQFRRERERNKRYTFGRQWDDVVYVDGKKMTEAEYIRMQGNLPAKNNLIRRLVKNVLGVYRSQLKEPVCLARDRTEQQYSETMTTILQYNMQLNRSPELLARAMEEFLISGLVVQRKWFGPRRDRVDCWTENISPADIIIDNNMTDPRGWDLSFIAQIHDNSWGDLCRYYAKSNSDYERLKEIYSYLGESDIRSFANDFGYSNDTYDFLTSTERNRYRVIEVWCKEQKARYRCHDYMTGEYYKIEISDYKREVEDVNASRIKQAEEVGMDINEVALIEATWFMDDYWYFYHISPFGDVLDEGETPYEHKEHPFVFKAYPLIDGEIHSFVADVIDQQRYVNRLIMMHDWILRASAKGVLMVPEDSIPEGTSIEDFAESWASFNGVIIYKPSRSGATPHQVHSNSTNIGINELLNVQLKFFEDISGVNAALQGKPGFSGESASHYAQQVDNATKSLLDILESFSGFVIDGAYKDVKNIQQYYDRKRVLNIAGVSASKIEKDPIKILDIEFDLQIAESTSSPIYRDKINEDLLRFWQAQAISLEQVLQLGNFPFADELLQSIQAQKQQVAQGQIPENISPALLQQIQSTANMGAVNRLSSAMAQ